MANLKNFYRSLKKHERKNYPCIRNNVTVCAMKNFGLAK